MTGTGWKARVQRFGGFLVSMVMPNIGAFIASPRCSSPPDGSRVVPFQLFVGDPAVEGVVKAIQGGATIDG